MSRLLRFVLAGALLSVLFASGARSQVSGIGYRLSPSGSYVLFEGDSAPEDGLFYGGSLGLSFGEFVELGGLFLTGDTDTDFANLSGVTDPGDQAALADCLRGA